MTTRNCLKDELRWSAVGKLETRKSKMEVVRWLQEFRMETVSRSVLGSREDTAFQRNDLTSKILDKINTNETAGNLTQGGGNEIHNTPPEILADIVLHKVGNSAPTPPLSVFT
ncbi:hypothetical protein TNCV_2433301 [Trichonephila clavipes]|nr:hypothetical protein TNCV_2433301 [Trichonephila clavipes]